MWSERQVSSLSRKAVYSVVMPARALFRVSAAPACVVSTCNADGVHGTGLISHAVQGPVHDGTVQAGQMNGNACCHAWTIDHRFFLPRRTTVTPGRSGIVPVGSITTDPGANFRALNSGCAHPITNTASV